VKLLRFDMRDRLKDGEVHCNWVVLKPWNTLSGPQAPISIGGALGGCEDSQVLEVVKTSDPEIIQPGVETDITYTVSISNLYNPSRDIESIIDYLPPEFEYVGPTEGAVTSDPQGTGETVNINGVDRYQLIWGTEEFGGGDLKIESGETLTFTFEAKATKDVSGSYYNEVFVILKTTGISAAFEAAGVEPTDYASNYSWNTGAVTVPTYDSRADAEGLVLDANMALLLESVSITSYQVR